MDNNTDKKNEIDYEEAYQKFLEARKSKSKGVPTWAIVATLIAVVMVVAVILVKPWSLFDNGESESTNIYETESDMSTQEMENYGQPSDGVGVPDDIAEPTPEAPPAEAPSDIPEETPAPEEPPQETMAPETAAETQAPTAAQADTSAVSDTTQTAGNEDSETSVIASTITAGRPVQDNAGLFSQAESDQINAMVETGDMTFLGIDFFVVANNGGEGMGNKEYAQEYYRQLVNKKMATGNGIVIFINTADMTANIVTLGTADSRLGSAGRKALTEDFVGVFRSSGNYMDAVCSVYYEARDIIMEQLQNEAETWGDTSDSWVENDEE